MFKLFMRKNKTITEYLHSIKRKPHSKQEYFNNILSFAKEVLKNTIDQPNVYKGTILKVMNTLSWM